MAAGLVDALEPIGDPAYFTNQLFGQRQANGVVRRYSLEVGPGKIRVGSSVTGSNGGGLQASRDWVDGVQVVTPEMKDEPPRWQAPRGLITEWSKGSRLNMVEKMCSVDWSPVVAPGAGWRPAMVTLTLPGDWLAVAPTAKDFKRLMERFWSRWERRWGKPTCVWKLEFQRRGAPHVHIYTAVHPGKAFQQWLSRTWYEVVGSGDERHLRAGTGIDWKDGIMASDPKRLAVYFLKRAAGHNLGRDKEYQHRVPVEWLMTGGAGRFWGVKGLAKAVVQVQLRDKDFVSVRRLLRRWAKANGRPVRSLAGGVGQGGMVLVNDAPNLLVHCVRALDGGPPTTRRPLTL